MRESRVYQVAFTLLAPLYLALIIGIPTVACGALVAAAGNWVLRSSALAVAPTLLGLLYVSVAALLSLPHQRAVVPGRFPRRTANNVYFHRRLYGLCWTATYYCTPLLFAILSLPWLKRVVLSVYGYRGHHDFTTYPDTWIRDLPLLVIGEGAYLSNKATIGTNVVMSDGSIVVDRVHIGRGAIVGHLAIIGPGTRIGDRAEVGVGVAIGFRSTIGDGARLGPCCRIEHGVEIGERSQIGATSQVLAGCRIGPGVKLPSGLTVPPKTVLDCQEDVDRFVSARAVAAGARDAVPAFVAVPA